MRIVFMGNHNMGVLCLEKLIQLGEEIVGVVAHPDDQDPFEKVWYKSVKEVALGHNVMVYQPRDVNALDFVDLLRGMTPDLIVVVSFRQILTKPIIALPKLGVVNVHPSLLPKYRGRANIAWAIINGETKTGVTVHYIDEKVDTGPIIVQKGVEIGVEDTVGKIMDQVTKLYPEALAEAIQKVKAGFKGIPQDSSQASYYGRRYPKDGLIDWNRPANAIYNLVRGVTHPYPGAFTYLRNKQLYVWDSSLFDKTNPSNGVVPGELINKVEGKGFVVSTGAGTVLLKSVQFEGEEEMDAWSFFQKEELNIGTRLSSFPSEERKSS